MKTMPYNLSIPTTSSVLTSLSQSKALTSMHDKNSVALTTGKIVNTSYDNSTLYFKDMRLTEQAEGLQSVLDGLSNIVSTLDTAGKSIDAITDLLSQAKAAANSALDGQAYLSVLTGKTLRRGTKKIFPICRTSKRVMKFCCARATRTKWNPIS